MKIKLAIIDHVGTKAGMDYYSSELAKALSRQNGPICLFSNFCTNAENIDDYPFFMKDTHSFLSKLKNHFTAFTRSVRKCRELDIDYVIIHIFSFQKKDAWVLKLLKKNKLKTVGIVHDIEYLAEGKNHRKKAQKQLEKYCDRIMVHNQFSLDELTGKISKNVSSKTFIAPHGNFHNLPKEIEAFEEKKKWNLDPQDKHLLFFGQIKPSKGLDILLQSASLFPSNVKIMIAGRTWKDDWSKYEQYIQENKLQNKVIKLIRYIGDEERNSLFQVCDAIVLPYRKIYQSGVLLMAAGYKTPLILSSIPAFKENVTDEEASFFETPGDLVDIVKQLAVNKQPFLHKAEKCYEGIAQRNSWNTTAKTILEHL